MYVSANQLKNVWKNYLVNRLRKKTEYMLSGIVVKKHVIGFTNSLSNSEKIDNNCKKESKIYRVCKTR